MLKQTLMISTVLPDFEITTAKVSSGVHIFNIDCILDGSQTQIKVL